MQRRRLIITVFAAFVLGLAVLVPIASAGSQPSSIEIPAWLTRMHFPGESTAPTVYLAGGVTIPASLARLQHPGASSQPTIRLGSDRQPQTRPVALVDYMDKIHYPGESNQPTVVFSQSASTGTSFDWTLFGVGVAAALGLALVAAAAVLALRQRRPLAHA